jgi:hypothetical protein
VGVRPHPGFESLPLRHGTEELNQKHFRKRIKEEKMKKVLLSTLSLLLVFSFMACKKKEEQPPLPQTQIPTMPPGQMPPGQMPPGQMPPGQMPSGQMPMMPQGKTQVIVPASVKGHWTGAIIVVEEKNTKAKHEYTVKLNSDFKVPNTNLKIHVGDFLPDFRMNGLSLTSASNQPVNPALSIRVFENNKQIFPAPGRQWGWLFSKVPSIHPFEHQKYGIILKEGIKK